MAPDDARPAERSARHVQDWPLGLLWVGVAVAVLAMVAPYVGPGLNTAASAEVADHVVPGAAILLVSTAMLVLARSPRAPSPTLLLAAGLLVCLAGLWMVLTHIPLLSQANRGEAPWPGAIWHTLSACVALGFGVVWAAGAWGELGDR